MLTGVVLERLPRWATEDAGKGQRRPADRGRPLAAAGACSSRSRLRLALPQPPQPGRVPRRERDAGAQVHQRAELAGYINEFTDWFVSSVDTFTIALKDTVTDLVINPLQDLLSESPWWLMALVLLAVAYVLGGWQPAAITVVCEAVILCDRPLERHDGHPGDDPDRHRAGDAPRGRARRRDGPEPTGRHRHPPVPRRLPGDPAVRLPGPGARAVRRRPASPPSSRRRYAVPIATKLVADGIRGVSPTTVEAARSTGITTLADDLQGPAADGARGAGARDQPGPALRAVDGRHRRHGRRRQPRLHRGLGVLAGRAVRQGLAAGIAIAALGIMLDRIARVRRGALRSTRRGDRLDGPPRSDAEAKKRKKAHGTRTTPIPRLVAPCRGRRASAWPPAAGGDIEDEPTPRRRRRLRRSEHRDQPVDRLRLQRARRSG